jgi:hypothetical protein
MAMMFFPEDLFALAALFALMTAAAAIAVYPWEV